MHWSILRGFCFLSLLSVLSWVGCGAPPDGNNNNNNNETKNVEPPKLPTDLKPGWNMIEGGQGTVCSRGSKFAFFARPGKINKVVIDFIGGGACWNASTCSIADAIFSDSVDPLIKQFQEGKEHKKGIYDHDREDNPFKDWYHVTIPYCTGDIHWGNNVVEYKPTSGKPFKINHKGAVNTRFVLDWIYKRFSKPETILVTGCSAGAYGSILWSAHIANQYKNSKIYQMGDCGAGIITDSFLKKSFPSWKAESAMPTWIPKFDPNKVSITDQDISYVYINVANHYKQHLFSQYNTAFDENQAFYFKAMGGGTADEWGSKMRTMLDKIKTQTPNFRSFVAQGKKHCIIVHNEFYEVAVNGVKFTSWLSDMLNGKQIEHVTCDKEKCKEPTVSKKK